jgi:multidrug resistance efflux pump
MARFARETLKTAATLLILVLAVLAALVIWDSYVTAPWTRDDSVRVQVARIASQVSGQITEVRVVDNQYVHKGDVLYVIDPFDFQVALDTGKAQLRQKAADQQVKRMQAERRQHLSDLATTPERARASSKYMPAAPSRRRRPSTPPSSRSRRPTSTSSGRRCAAP